MAHITVDPLFAGILGNIFPATANHPTPKPQPHPDGADLDRKAADAFARAVELMERAEDLVYDVRAECAELAGRDSIPEMTDGDAMNMVIHHTSETGGWQYLQARIRLAKNLAAKMRDQAKLSAAAREARR
jgi:hypothetical protein